MAFSSFLLLSWNLSHMCRWAAIQRVGKHVKIYQSTWNLPGLVLELSPMSGKYLEISRTIPGTFRESSWKPRRRFRDFSGNCPGHFLDTSGRFPSCCQEHLRFLRNIFRKSGRFLEMSREQSRKCPRTFRDKPRETSRTLPESIRDKLGKSIKSGNKSGTLPWIFQEMCGKKLRKFVGNVSFSLLLIFAPYVSLHVL